MEFPAYVFRDGGPHKRAGGTYDSVIVKSESEWKEKISDGWFSTIGDAIEGKVEEPLMQRSDLEAKATALGIKFDGRTKDHKLAAMIAEKEA